MRESYPLQGLTFIYFAFTIVSKVLAVLEHTIYWRMVGDQVLFPLWRHSIGTKFFAFQEQDASALVYKAQKELFANKEQ